MMTELARQNSSYARLLSNRPFFLLWIGQLVSQSGDYVFAVVFVWLTYTMTRSVFLVGVVLAVAALPRLLVRPVAGVFVDRHNRKDVMIASSISQGLITAAIAFLYFVGNLQFLAMSVLIFLLLSGAQFYYPAFNATIPNVTDRANLAAANGLLSVSSSMNQLVGYSMGGLLIAATGPTLPVYYDSATFFFVAITVTLVPRVCFGAKDSAARSSFLGGFAQGLRYIRSTPFLIQLILMGVVLNFLVTVMGSLLAPYTSVQLNGDATAYGIILASMAFGSIMGSILVGKVNPRRYMGKVIFASMFAMGAFLTLISAVTALWVAALFVSFFGLSNAAANVPVDALIQAKVPNSMLGRVEASLTSFLSLGQPVAAFVSGAVAGLLGIGGTYLIFGTLILVSGAAFLIFFKELRQAAY